LAQRVLARRDGQAQSEREKSGPEVTAAMQEAAQYCVDMAEIQAAATADYFGHTGHF
jgi:hypothetical protein